VEVIGGLPYLVVGGYEDQHGVRYQDILGVSADDG